MIRKLLPGLAVLGFIGTIAVAGEFLNGGIVSIPSLRRGRT